MLLEMQCRQVTIAFEIGNASRQVKIVDETLHTYAMTHCFMWSMTDEFFYAEFSSKFVFAFRPSQMELFHSKTLYN